MELTCPSCEARYRVPDDAIGENGRQVSCSNCGHGWHAARPLVLRDTVGAGAATGYEAGHGAGSFADDDEPGGAEIHRLRPAEPARAAQLAEIRNMIAQVQSDDAAAGDGTRRLSTTADPGREPEQPAAGAAQPATAGTMVRPSSDFGRAEPAGDTDAGAYQDPLRRRMAEHDARAARERAERERLRHSMRDGGAARSSGSGAFLTGFLLVVIVAAVLLAAYALQPEIVARVPDAEPMMSEYVAVVDDLRREIDRAWEAARAWVLDLARR